MMTQNGTNVNMNMLRCDVVEISVRAITLRLFRAHAI
jgi:hypothetical protein